MPAERDVFETEHGQLVANFMALLAHLRSMRGQFRPRGDVDHAQHHEFGEQAVFLSVYLSAAVELARDGIYPAAFAVVRSSLEHHVLDHLYFLANRYARVFADVSDERLAEWRSQLGTPGFDNVISVERLGRNKARVVFSGPHLQGQGVGLDAPGISIYYGLLDDYDPFLPRASVQPALLGDFVGSLERRQQRARENAALWQGDLKWDRLRANLALNGFYEENELVRWDVHYSFLSAFAHPTPRAIQRVWGRNIPSGAPRYDHYCSELVLLYAITLARLELMALRAMADREPRVDVDGWDAIELDLTEAGSVTSYFWFPRGRPHEFDRVEQANRLGVRNDHPVPMNERPNPEELDDAQVAYYADPLTRLVKMHANIDELSGFPYRSRWPREDAWLRSVT